MGVFTVNHFLSRLKLAIPKRIYKKGFGSPFSLNYFKPHGEKYVQELSPKVFVMVASVLC